MAVTLKEDDRGSGFAFLPAAGRTDANPDRDTLYIPARALAITLPLRHEDAQSHILGDIAGDARRLLVIS